MPRPTSPLRADHVGSLLRPASVIAARKQHFEDRPLSADGLKAAKDVATAVTDGEVRRSFWHYVFHGHADRDGP